MDKRWAVPPGITPFFNAVLTGICRGGHLVQLPPDKTPFCELEVECGRQVIAVTVSGPDAPTVAEIEPGTPVEIAGALEVHAWTGRDGRQRERVIMIPKSFVSLGPVLSEVEIGEYKACRTDRMQTTC